MKLRIILFALAFISFNSPLWAQFTIPAMPYAYDALEPAIDSMTMRIHHQRHHQAYVNGLNEALAGQGNISLEELMKNMSKYSDKARNNGGGHYCFGRCSPRFKIPNHLLDCCRPFKLLMAVWIV
jgi:Fe-Mn family superoxide dismutase